MRAVGYVDSLPVGDERALFDFEAPMPQPGPHDLLVRVRAVAVNPIDTKIRMRRQGTAGTPAILGWDAAGEVVATGANVSLFRPGDEVYYAGSIIRPGSNAQFGLVDERIAGHKPSTLSFDQAAALPLTALTAWEALFDRFKIGSIKPQRGESILIIGGAGGVGSMAIQLAKLLTPLKVVATAARPESREWAEQLGADVVVDHSGPLDAVCDRAGCGAFRYIFSTTQTDRHWDAITTLLAPQGEICVIDDPVAINPMQLKSKAGALHLELMFARSTHATPDMIRQHEILDEVSRLVDAGALRTTMSGKAGTMSAESLRAAHATLESGTAIGKIVLSVSQDGGQETMGNTGF